MKVHRNQNSRRKGNEIYAEKSLTEQNNVNLTFIIGEIAELNMQMDKIYLCRVSGKKYRCL